MRTVIYYFSATGNSLRAAEKLRDSISESELIPIVQAVTKREYSHSSERIGFVFPLYFYSFPKIVMDFIERFDFTGKRYIFIVVTCGNEGGVIAHTKKILAKKGTDLSAGFYIKMPHNDVTFIFPVPSIKKQKKILDSVDLKIQKITKRIIANEKYFEREWLGFIRHIRHTPAYLKGLENGWKKFYTNEKCNACGICEKICLQNNIKMIEKRPTWESNCQLCEACINFCPKEAIQYGTITIGRMRYHHPDCSWKDILIQKQN